MNSISRRQHASASRISGLPTTTLSALPRVSATLNFLAVSEPPAEKTFCLNFSYVCPERVWVKTSFLV